MVRVILSLLLFLICCSACLRLVGASPEAGLGGGVLILAVIVGASIAYRFLQMILGGGKRRGSGTSAGMSLAILDDMNGAKFESWICETLADAGIEVRDTPHAGDFGVDVLCFPPKVPGGVAIQAKRFKRKVGNAAVQQAIAGAQFYDCGAAVVVTQSFFTKAAKRQAREADPPVLLVDRNEVLDVANVIRRHRP